MIEDISFKSPPSSLASTYADDAVGIAANSTNSTIFSLSKPNGILIIKTIKGKTNNLLKEDTISAIFVFLSSDKCNPTPTDKRPKGSAAELKIERVFSISKGKLNPRRFKLPPKRHAKISGLEKIDFVKDKTDILFLGTYIEKINIHNIFINGIRNVISNIPITNPLSPNKASISAKNT
jgi:hypothetical protein